MESLVKIKLEMEREAEEYKKKDHIIGWEIVMRMIGIVEKQMYLAELSTSGKGKNVLLS